MKFRKELLERARSMAKEDTDIFPIFVQLLIDCHRRNEPTLYGDVSTTGLPSVAKCMRAS